MGLLETILKSIFCPIVVALITTLISNIIEKRRKLKKEFYLNFYDLYIKTHMGRAYSFSDLEENDQKAFINLIIENEKNARGLLLNLFYEFLVSVQLTEEGIMLENRTNRIFNEITDIVFENVKTKYKITAKDRRKFNRRAKHRNAGDDEVFYIKSIDKNGIIQTYE